MTLNLWSARRLALRLARGEVRAEEQAAYLTAGALVWLMLYYLYVIPSSYLDDPAWHWPIWWYEGLTLTLVNGVGYFYCLRQCTISPSRNFLVDFCCLYAPVAISTLIVTWLVFHGLVKLIPLMFSLSLTFYEALRLVAYLGSSAIIFIRTGAEIHHVAKLREQNTSSTTAMAVPP